MSDLVRKAKRFAIEKHKGQVRKRGEDYVEHPLRVSKIVARFWGSEEEIAAALLHDVLEECDCDIVELRREFGDKVAGFVLDLTDDKVKHKGFDKVKYLIHKLCNKDFSNEALFLKLADRLDNVSDLGDWDIEFARKVKRQTLEILNELEKCRKLNEVCEKLVFEIRKKLERLEV